MLVGFKGHFNKKMEGFENKDEGTYKQSAERKIDDEKTTVGLKKSLYKQPIPIFQFSLVLNQLIHYAVNRAISSS